MKEEVAARELNDGHPRRERPRHLHSKERHVLERPIRDPYVWGKRFVRIDGFVESGGGFDWHFSRVFGFANATGRRPKPFALEVCDMGASLYEPINVYKPLARGHRHRRWPI